MHKLMHRTQQRVFQSVVGTTAERADGYACQETFLAFEPSCGCM